MSAPVQTHPRPNVAAGVTSYVAIGDSFTAGTGCPEGERWADLVAARLAASRPGFAYRNLAVEGATSERVVEDQLEPALELEPDMVSVVCGANDVLFSVRPDAATYGDRLAGIFDRLAAVESPPLVFTATAPDRFDFLELGPRTRARLERGIVAFNETTRAVAQRHGVLCLDVAGHPGLAEPENFVEDGLHPSSLGHKHAAIGFSWLLGLDSDEDR